LQRGYPKINKEKLAQQCVQYTRCPLHIQPTLEVDLNADILMCRCSPVATGGCGGLILPSKTLSPPNWYKKHYESMEFLSNFKCQASLLKTFWRRFCVGVQAGVA